MTNIRTRNFARLVVAALLVCSAAWADPPARVGRLNLIQGSVSFMAGDTDEWITAAVNYPLTAGDCLWTDASSQAEAHVGSTAIRIDAGTEFGFLELDDAQVRIRLQRGLLNVRLRELESGESFTVDTPAMSVSLLAPGSYRVELADSGDARASVSEGEIVAVVAGLAYPVHAGQTASVARSDALSIRIGKAPAQDAWDLWCAERDRREDRLASVQYVPRSMIGCEDLDWYGNWSVTVEFGPVWTPSRLPAGWAPYRHGHWAWVRPWGWTWIDDMPWGFAPFHYGRWALVRGAWVWVPGSKVHRPVYAPALVAFVEAAANGSIGWFPLGPREPYIPAYPASRGYLKEVNVTHVQIGDRETIDTSRIRYAHREAGQVYTQAPRQSFSQVPHAGDSRVQAAASQRETRPASSGSLLGAITQLAREWSSGHGREPKARRNSKPVVQQGRESRAERGREAIVQKGREPKAQQKWQKIRKKKTLANGQVVWVEELAPVEE